MAPRPQNQTAIDERVIEDRALERVLEDREKAKATKGEAVKTFKTKDERAKELIEEAGIADDDVVRVGRFRVKKSRIDSRSVEFETSPTSRLNIGVAPDEV